MGTAGLIAVGRLGGVRGFPGGVIRLPRRIGLRVFHFLVRTQRLEPVHDIPIEHLIAVVVDMEAVRQVSVGVPMEQVVERLVVPQIHCEIESR